MTFRRDVLWVALALSVPVALASAETASAAITSTNTTNDSTTVTYAYQYSSVGQWYRTYIDSDRSAASGFAIGGIGANFLLENGSLYRHVGPGWAWALVNAVTYSNTNTVVSWTFPRADVGETNCTSESADVIFQVEASGSPADTSGLLTHSFIPCASPVVNDRATNDATNVFYKFQYTSTWSLFQVYIDTDRSTATGYSTAGIGADYFIENGTLYRHTGGSSSWTWNNLGAVTYSNASGNASWSVSRTSLGETQTNESADVVYRVQASPNSAALPKRTHVYFGGTGGSGGGGGGPTGTMVPLYTYPNHPSWAAIIAAKNDNPTVPVIAVVNPSNGPGTAVDSNYTAGITSLHNAGIKVLGYVFTDYAARSEALVQADIQTWRTFYPLVDGIFFDEMSNDAGEEGYYSDQDTFARSKGFTYTVGNPGADTIPSYVGVVDMILVYERAGLEPLPTWYSGYPRDNFGVIPYNVPSLDANYVATTKQNIGFIYMTNDNLPNPWDSLPPYFSSLLAELAQ